MGQPRAAFGLFTVFSSINKILQQINVKNDPSSIQPWLSNSRPFEHESAPITTTPRLSSDNTRLRKKDHCIAAPRFNLRFDQKRAYFVICM